MEDFKMTKSSPRAIKNIFVIMFLIFCALVGVVYGWQLGIVLLFGGAIGIASIASSMPTKCHVCDGAIKKKKHYWDFEDVGRKWVCKACRTALSKRRSDAALRKMDKMEF
jgi:hypothetical protein